MKKKNNMYGIVDAPDNDGEAVRMQKCIENGDYSDFQVPVNTVFDGDNLCMFQAFRRFVHQTEKNEFYVDGTYSCS